MTFRFFIKLINFIFKKIFFIGSIIFQILVDYL